MRAKTVLSILRTEAIEQDAANSKFFDPKEVPGSPTDRRAYFNELTHQVVEGWLRIALDKAYDRKKRALENDGADKKTINKHIKNREKQQTNVTAVGNLMEKWHSVLWTRRVIFVLVA